MGCLQYIFGLPHAPDLSRLYLGSQDTSYLLVSPFQALGFSEDINGYTLAYHLHIL